MRQSSALLGLALTANSRREPSSQAAATPINPLPAWPNRLATMMSPSSKVSSTFGPSLMQRPLKLIACGYACRRGYFGDRQRQEQEANRRARIDSRNLWWPVLNSAAAKECRCGVDRFADICRSRGACACAELSDKTHPPGCAEPAGWRYRHACAACCGKAWRDVQK